MNIHKPNPAPAAKLPEPASEPWRRLEGDPAVDELLQRIARQSRHIQALERLISSETGRWDRPSVVRLKAGLANQASPVPVAARAAARTWASWPGKPMPTRAMEPPPGAAHLDVKGAGAKVIAFALFGLSEEQVEKEVEKEVERVSEQQALQGNFIPVFLTSSPNTEPFRRRGYLFEYFPSAGGPRAEVDLAALQPRLDVLESKWGIDHFINLGHPAGKPIRRESRPPRERYLEAKARFSAGRFASAQRILGDFTQDTLEHAKVRAFGRGPVSPSASIVIVSHRDHPGVEDGLQSIARQIRPDQYEVILVDNGNASLAALGRKIVAACTVIDVGFNAGCSGARNVGASQATSPVIIFLDDDGITEEGCIAALMDCIRTTGAVAVRGRVKALTAPHLEGSHYNLGDAQIPALTTCEGVSVWRRDPFLAAGGFDPLLAGREGVALCARLWRFHGPAGFVYEPSAVLLHDCAPDAAATAAKNRRYRASMDYLNFIGLRWQDITAGQARFVADPILGYLALQAPRRLSTPAPLSVSIVTTARNAQHFLAEYTAALKAQTSPDFQVIFVDDHSEDDTLGEIARLWANDPRLSFFTNTGSGRGAALNEAMRHASGEICIIHDVDDLSVPCRVGLTRAYFGARPEADCLSFVAFNESNPFRLGPPRSLSVGDLSVRQLFGMPASFPTFAFRRSSFTQPFDEELLGGIDCDWWFRNSGERPLTGEVVFYPAVYYREHPGQITSTRKDQQLAVRRRHVAAAYERLLGGLDPHDHRYIQVLTETKQLPASEKNILASWVARLLQKNRDSGMFRAEQLDHAMSEVLRDVTYVKDK